MTTLRRSVGFRDRAVQVRGGYRAPSRYRGAMISKAAISEGTAPHLALRNRSNAPARGPVGPHDPRWLRLGLAGVLGFVAGTMLFPTRAEGGTHRVSRSPARASRAGRSG